MTDPYARLTSALADRYAIARELGTGGMATVYLARDLKHDREVAIKVLHAELGGPLGSDRFLQEIRLAARLQHPHIVGLLDSGVIGADAGGEALWYYVMPFVEGESLRERLSRGGPLPVADAARLIGEIADALAKAHRAGVVHRDIKPENILLADGHAMVMDFGVAKAVSAAGAGRHGVTTAGVSLGTPAYMAPEQVAADPAIDHRADLYALGLVAYEMLAGGSPYSATTPAQQMAAHVTQPPLPISEKRLDCPPALASLIMRCLAKSPGDRWQSADEVVTALRAADLTAAPASSRLARRLLGAAAVFALLAAGVFVLRRFGGGADAAATSGDNTVGVMLFDNITHDSADAYLADGLASEIATSLARVPRLEVRSPGAVRSAERGREADPREVGRRLNVRNVVEGEFQRGGDRIRIAARLVAVPSGTQRWSESWTRPVTDLLAVQEEIARAVATAIAGTLQPQERTVLAARPTTDPDAYDHFLRGNFDLARRSPTGIRRAIEEYGIANRLDPTFAQAEARIALAYSLYAEWGWDFPGMSRDSLVTLGALATDRALALDSTLADAWMDRGRLLYLRHPRTLEGALPALERATVLDPRNAEAWHQYSSTLMIAGQFEEALTPLRRALAIEPGRTISWANLGATYWALGRDREELAALDSSIAADPEFYVAYCERVWNRLRAGDRAGARANAEAAARTSPPGEEYYGLASRAAVAAADGDTVQARRLMTEAVAPFSARPLGGIPAQPIVLGFLAAGQRDLALTWLERATPRGSLLWWAMQVPETAPLREDRRYKKVMEESKPPGR
jgi:TolB-like protein/Tfp pilus assembly protein PilF